MLLAAAPPSGATFPGRLSSNESLLLGLRIQPPKSYIMRRQDRGSIRAAIQG
jgi:hypothetical protein